MGESRFCGAQSFQNFEGPILENEHKITNTKSGTKVNIYVGPLPEPWKGAVQVKGP